MAYTDGQLEQMTQALREWSDRGEDLFERLITHQFRNQRASEFAQHGLGRRMRMLRHTIERVFAVLPPNADRPSFEQTSDATSFLQTFVINCFGSIDNLARIWVHEARVVQPSGAQLPDTHIGLGPRNRTVRASLPADFQARLDEMDDWYGYLESYRHALAHRIPLYIPPKILNEQEGDEYGRLERDIAAAMLNRDRARWRDLQEEQWNIGRFRPMMMHSIDDDARPMFFHAQVICDYSTIIDLGEYMHRALVELDRQPDVSELETPQPMESPR